MDKIDAKAKKILIKNLKQFHKMGLQNFLNIIYSLKDDSEVDLTAAKAN